LVVSGVSVEGAGSCGGGSVIKKVRDNSRIILSSFSKPMNK
jgi:hypothetical protein